MTECFRIIKCMHLDRRSSEQTHNFQMTSSSTSFVLCVNVCYMHDLVFDFPLSCLLAFLLPPFQSRAMKFLLPATEGRRRGNSFFPPSVNSSQKGQILFVVVVFHIN